MVQVHGPPQQFGQVMVRTGSGCSAPPLVKLHSIKAFVAVPVQRPQSEAVDCPNIPNILHDIIVSTESCKRVESQHRKVNKVTSVDVYDYSKVEELSQLFSVSDVVMYNGAKKVADDPLTIELTAQPFAYGLALLPRLELLDSDDALVVECTLTVERGKVMVGGLHKNLAEYIAPEILVVTDSVDGLKWG
jgi:hypothetical protein